MRLCAAQLRPVRGDLAANLARHQQLVALAAAHGADAVFFPELSLTGYEPALARALAADPTDARLTSLQALADAHGLTIGAGLPLPTATAPRIGLVLFQPRRPPHAYAKQLLHADELPYFVAGHGQVLVEVGGVQVAPAICYESLQPAHAATAHALGAGAYVACVAKSQAGVDRAGAHYPQVAATYRLPVLMANCVGPADDFVAAGQSAAWGPTGARLAALDATTEGLVLCDLATGAATVVELRG